MKFTFVFTFAALLTFSSQAVDITNKPNPAGQELAAELRNSVPPESEISGVLKVRSSTNKFELQVHAEAKMEGEKWKTIYTVKGTNESPLTQFIIVHGTNVANEYYVSRAKGAQDSLPKPARVKYEEAATVSLAGSDFTIADLGLDFLHWPEQTRLDGQLRLGRDCYLLESRNPRAEEMVRVKSWVDKESNGVLVAEGYNAKGEKVKVFSLSGSSFKKVKGRWELEKMTIYSPKKKSETILQFDLPKD